MPVPVKHYIYDDAHLMSMYPNIKHGGEWWPSSCTAREKIAVIVPFKNRDHHLPYFTSVIHPFLIKQNVHYRIFIVNQVYKMMFFAF